MRITATRLPLLAGLLVVAAAPSASSAESFTPPPGFQVDLAGGTHVECSVVSKALRCLDYSRAAAPGRCDVGGDVPTTVLRRTGPLRRTFTCVDEGYHGWKVLKSSGRFRSGPYVCRLRDGRRALRCSNATRTVTVARTRG